MMPDLSRVREKVAGRLYERFHAGTQNHSPFLRNVCNIQFVHEGKSGAIQRRDGSKQSIPTDQVSSQLQVPVDDLEKLSIEDYLKKVDEMASDFAGKQTSTMLRRIGDTLRDAGQAIDGAGKSFGDNFLECIRKIELDFDKDGQALFPTLVMGSAQMDKHIEAMRLAEADPAFREAFGRLIEEKRDDWYARKARRKLVD